MRGVDTLALAMKLGVWLPSLMSDPNTTQYC